MYPLRIVLLLCSFSFLCTSVSAQTRPITIEKKWYGPVFKYDNLIVTGVNFRNAMLEDPAALKALSGSGGLEIASGVLSGLGTVVALTALVNTDGDADYLFGNRGTDIAAGVGTTALAFVLNGIVNRKRRRAVGVYNGNLQLKIETTENGIGLGYRF